MGAPDRRGARGPRPRRRDPRPARAALADFSREEILGELERIERANREAEQEAAEHHEAMRRLAGCRCPDDGGQPEALDIELDGHGVVTFAGCRGCGASRKQHGTIGENLDARRRAIYAERTLSYGLKAPARWRAACAAARRPSSSRRTRRRHRRSGPPRGRDPDSDGPGDAGPPPAGAR